VNEETLPFKIGDRVRIKRNPSAGQSGTVINTLSMGNRAILCELVWVRLADGRVDGFHPGSLERLGGRSNLQAA